MLLVAKWQERWPCTILHLSFERGQGWIHVRNRILRVYHYSRTLSRILLFTVSAWAAWDWPAGIYIYTIVFLGSESWDYSHYQGRGAMLAGCSKPFEPPI